MEADPQSFNPDDVRSVSELRRFIQDLRVDIESEEPSIQSLTLDDFLEGISAWLNDTTSENLKAQGLADSHTLRAVAVALHAGATYE